VWKQTRGPVPAGLGRAAEDGGPTLRNASMAALNAPRHLRPLRCRPWTRESIEYGIMEHALLSGSIAKSHIWETGNPGGFGSIPPVNNTRRSCTQTWVESTCVYSRGQFCRDCARCHPHRSIQIVGNVSRPKYPDHADASSGRRSGLEMAFRHPVGQESWPMHGAVPMLTLGFGSGRGLL
jgi:hypothetical protein